MVYSSAFMVLDPIYFCSPLRQIAGALGESLKAGPIVVSDCVLLFKKKKTDKHALTFTTAQKVFQSDLLL